MKNLKLIIAHEYMTMVGKKSFIIMTVLIPFLILLIIAVPVGIAYLNSNDDSNHERIAVLDESPARYGTALRSEGRFEFQYLAAEPGNAKPRDFYEPLKGVLTAVVFIPADVDSTGDVRVYSEQTLSTSTMNVINKSLSDTIKAARLQAHGIENLQQILDDCNVDIDAKSIKWDKDGKEERSSTDIAMIVGLVLSLFTYTFVLMYGAMIMNSVVEEKTNRIVEVVVSSCKPVELMFGKVIGVGLVGLTQFAVWVVMGLVAMMLFGMSLGGTVAGSSPAVAPGMHEMASTVSVPSSLPVDAQAVTEAAGSGSDASEIMQMAMSIPFGSILLHFVLYFIGGYMLYASLFAAFGSAVDQASDASQFTTPIILIMIIALYAGMACIDNPNGPMAMWCSLIPFTSPVVMMVRLPYDVPFWQIFVSIVLLYVTALLMTWLAARIYRTGILLYGKKRSFREIFRWIKG